MGKPGQRRLDEPRPGPLGPGIHAEAPVKTTRKTKYIHEAGLVAEVEVELIEDDSSWSPCLSVSDAMRLDAARAALRAGDLDAAAAIGTVYRLEPIRTAKHA
jgi:hypothetical protein